MSSTDWQFLWGFCWFLVTLTSFSFIAAAGSPWCVPVALACGGRVCYHLEKA